MYSSSFKSADARFKEYKDMAFSLQVAPEDCTGCTLCVEVCPVKNRQQPKFKAINMAPQAPLREQEAANWDFFLGLPEIDVGLLGGQRHAMRLFSHSRLRTMALTGQRIFGPELYRTGVVEACVAPEALMETAMDMARTLAAKSPIAMRMAKGSLNAIEEMSLRDGYRYEQNLTGELGKTEDSREAMLAFAEKRKPVFKGR